MKVQPFITVIAGIFFLASPSLFGQVQFWDPDGATVGTSVSGNWDLLTPNWTLTVDSGANSAWMQGNEADFVVGADFIVTLGAPITIGNLTISGTAGTLTISGTSPNILTLGSSSIFNIGSRTANISAPIGGAFDLTKSGSGTVVFSGANTYSGGTMISSGSGAIGIGVDTVSSGGVITSSALGTGPITVNTAGHVLFASGTARILENSVALNAGITIGGTQNVTFRNGNWVVNAGTRVITVTNTALTRIESNLTDDGAARTLQKAGTGTLVLAGNNSAFLGPLTVNSSSGTLALGSDSALQVGGVVTVSTGSVLDMNGFNGKVVGLAGAGAVNLGTNTLTIANLGTSRNFTGVINGTGGLVVSNGVSQQIEGNNTFSGGILINQGTLFLRTNSATSGGISQAAGTGTITIDDTGATPHAAIGANYSTGVVRITNNIFLKTGRGLFFPSNGGTNQFDGIASGPGGFLRDNNGSGLVIITGNNTYSGGLQIESRAIALGHKNAPGTGTFVIGNPTTAPASTLTVVPLIDLSGANAITNPVTVNQNFTTFGTNDIELSGAMTLANPVVVTTLGSNVVKFSGRIDGLNGLTKDGSSTLTLSGANTYTGDTAVIAGTLLINNGSGSGTSTGTVTIASGATLGGIGTIGGPVIISFQGSISAGNGVGKLTLTNGLDLSGGGINIWELGAEKDGNNGIAGTDFDQLSLTGGNLALGGASVLRVQFTNSVTTPNSTNAFWQANHAWKIISLSGGATNAGQSNFSAIDGTNDISAGTFSTSVDGGGNVILTYISASPPRPVIDSNISGAGTTNATIRWSSVNGVTYQVQYKNDLNDATWNVLGSVTATNSTASIIDTNNPPAPTRFYRTVVQ